MRGPRPMGGPGPMMGISPLEMRALTDNDVLREKFRASMRDARSEIGPAMRESFQARRGISAALKAEPYDAEAIVLAFEEAEAADKALRDLSQTTILNFLNSLNDTERAALVEALENTPGLFRDRRKGPGDGGPRFGKRFRDNGK